MITDNNRDFIASYGSAKSLDQMIDEKKYPALRHFFSSHPTDDIVRNPSFNTDHFNKMAHDDKLSIRSITHVLKNRPDVDVHPEYQKYLLDNGEYRVRWEVAEHTKNPDVLMHIAKTQRPDVFHSMLDNPLFNSEHLKVIADRHNQHRTITDQMDSRHTLERIKGEMI